MVASPPTVRSAATDVAAACGRSPDDQAAPARGQGSQ